LSWKKIKHPSEQLKKKDEVKAIVLNIDKANCRISLGVKQLQPDPWDDIAKSYSIGMDVEGTIIKITGFGAFAEFGDGLEGLIHITQLDSKTVSQPEKIVEVGQKIQAKIIKVDTSNKKIALSIKAFKEKLDLDAIEQEQSRLETFKEEENEPTTD
jgi:small subunit ribosomal protein S1